MCKSEVLRPVLAADAGWLHVINVEAIAVQDQVDVSPADEATAVLGLMQAVDQEFSFLIGKATQV